MNAPVRIRPPGVAGAFYPAGAHGLRELVERSFAAAVAPTEDAPVPAALVVPHAGLVYSGPIAASAYLRIVPARHRIRRVVLLGPSHHVALRGIATTSADVWRTPLGDVAVDTETVRALAADPLVTVDDAAHAPEHCLEVQLPFLQHVLDDVAIVPLLVGETDAADVAALIERMWDDPGTLVVVSTDLSHYHAYADAEVLDARTAAAVVAMRPDHIGPHDACGARPLRGLLRAAHDEGRHVEEIDRRSSGDTAGDRRRVVGYGAFAVC
jgi:AmmeMemoRadiSam system protein B